MYETQLLIIYIKKEYFHVLSVTIPPTVERFTFVKLDFFLVGIVYVLVVKLMSKLKSKWIP